MTNYIALPKYELNDTFRQGLRSVAKQSLVGGTSFGEYETALECNARFEAQS